MPQHKLGRLASIWSAWILPGSCAKFVKTLVLIQIRRLAQSLRASRLMQKLVSPIKTSFHYNMLAVEQIGYYWVSLFVMDSCIIL